MFFATFEYDEEIQAREDLELLWERKFGGETALKPSGDGRWFLELGLEKEPTQNLLEKLRGKRI